MSEIENGLSKNKANYASLSPLSFLERTRKTFPNQIAIEYKDYKLTYQQAGERCEALAEFVRNKNYADGSTIAVMLPNIPVMWECHFGIPMATGVLNAINTRLDSFTVRFILEHGESKMFIYDSEYSQIVEKARENLKNPPLLIEYVDKIAGNQRSSFAKKFNCLDYETELEKFIGFKFEHILPTDEWNSIALNYTSGTTDDPKGVVLHHRGAYLNSLGNVLALGFGKLTKYLWTLPMFHCNGWCHTWAITAAGGTHVCLNRVDPALILQTLHEQKITHFSCAPVVLYMLLGHPAIENFQPTRRVTVATGGASPTSRLIENMEKLGFDFIHLYGLTESFGPTSLRLLSQLEKKLNTEEKAELLARQGVRHTTANRIQVLDESGKDVPWDGITNGEIVLSGNTLFAGYYRNREATEAAFRSGGFHTGDIAVVHPNGDFEIRDRSKDIIISGGENISSLEVEAVLHNHSDVSIAAVVARPDEQWGEVPCAFIELKQGTNPTSEELRLHCRSALAGFKVPKFFIFCDLPKTATGKIRKVELRDQAKKL